MSLQLLTLSNPPASNDDNHITPCVFCFFRASLVDTNEFLELSMQRLVLARLCLFGGFAVVKKS
jgi:hypothetical protein